MKKSLLHEALNYAIANLENHGEAEFLHWSFITQNNKIVEWGANMGGEPPIHYGYHKQAKGPDFLFVPKIHAEIRAWKKARGLLDPTRSFQCINIRLNKTGKVRLSKPCDACYSILTELGCDKFYYSSEVGFLKI